MTLDLAALFNLEATTTVQLGDLSFDVRYAPNKLSVDAFNKVIKAQKDADIDTLAGMMIDAIIGWDLTLNGEPYPVTRENLGRLPIPVFGQLITAVLREVRDPNGEGSLQSGSSLA